MARKKDIKNTLDMIPVRNYEWKEKEVVTVLVPRFRSRLGQRFCKLIKKDPTYNVNLDKLGSFAWKLCNGTRTVRDIGKNLSEEFGDEVEPINQRVSELFNIMEANKLITYKKLNNHSPSTGGVENGPD
jgi:hypothetical protein